MYGLSVYTWEVFGTKQISVFFRVKFICQIIQHNLKAEKEYLLCHLDKFDFDGLEPFRGGFE